MAASEERRQSQGTALEPLKTSPFLLTAFAKICSALLMRGAA
jgi:hypothetical protein